MSSPLINEAAFADSVAREGFKVVSASRAIANEYRLSSLELDGAAPQMMAEAMFPEN